jgi:hypothetical protein
MLAIASSNAPSVDPWQSASSSADCSAAQLSGACALLAILVQAQATSQSGSRTDIELCAKKLDELKQQLADAIQKAKDAADDSGFFGFLGDVFGSDIAQIAGAVATIAAVVATGGAAAPLIAIALSEALQLAAKVGPELGLSPELCLALGVASVAVGFCGGSGGGQALGSLADSARDVQFVAKITQGVGTVQGGVLHYVAGQYRADSLNCQADAVGINAKTDATNLDLDDALELLSRSLRTTQHETGTASEIIQNNSDTNTSICDRI